jgi:crossover junction endodeoxyribonuclease RuvC
MTSPARAFAEVQSISPYRIGIDPGVSGALALIAPDDSLSDLIDMPTMLLTGKRQTVNAAELGKVLRGWLMGSHSTIAILEQVSAMPGQGVSSMFSFGTSYGIVQGVMAALQIPLHFVRPQAWKQRAGIPPKSEKDLARTVAQRLYPAASLERKKDIGRADAILIARYGAEPFVRPGRLV